MTPDQVFSVQELVGELRNLLETSYRAVWIEGEISGLAKPASGHLYFSLKEHNAVIRCAFFRNRRARSITPTEGMQVLVRGQISVYESRGDLQLIVSHLEEAGEGALRRAFDVLKNKLLAAGLFEQDQKQSIPNFPRAIGVITSPSGAALQDILITLARRYPIARIVLYPVLVQGQQAPAKICQMLKLADQRKEVDVLILARGGGSLEDLQAFNEETVARAIYHCKIPVVAGIGHETDITIADLVSDQRAPTPTAAAELVAPLQDNLASDLNLLSVSLRRQIERYLDQLRQKVDYAAARLNHPNQRLEKLELKQRALKSGLFSAINQQLIHADYQLERSNRGLHFFSPVNRLADIRRAVIQLQHQIRQRIVFELSDNRRKLQYQKTSIQIMSPGHTLNRGYTILQNRQGKIVDSTTLVKTNQKLIATVSNGQFGVKVLADE